MKEIPILFQSPMVRAILKGEKTQTRRVKSHGKVGDILWVRETWAETFPVNRDERRVIYKADDETAKVWTKERYQTVSWKPSIHIRREDARIELEVLDVRMERLNAITPEDALAEGSLTWWLSECDYSDGSRHEDPNRVSPEMLRVFAAMWDSINGPGHFKSNPNVNVVTFKKVKP